MKYVKISEFSPELFASFRFFFYLCSDKTVMMMKEATTLNEAQLSILRLLGSMKTIEEVDELRQVICDYYARRVDEEMDKLWESGQWDNEKNEAILKEHLRTPYKQ